MSFPEVPGSFRSIFSAFLSTDLAQVLGNKRLGYFPKAFFDFGSRYRTTRNTLPKGSDFPSGLADADNGTKAFFTEERYHDLATTEEKQCFLLGYTERQFYTDGMKRNHHVKRLTTLWDYVNSAGYSGD